MLLAQVKGHVVSTAKVDNLNGRTLLLVEVVTVRPDGLHGTGRDLVCVDAVGAGKGEVVLAVMGSSARTAPELGTVPTDAAVIAILDVLTADGQRLDLNQVAEAAG
ncbi:MAG TPA: EutN/CcmL family microcompartment protein [Candidatus Latescibacteria bacterium]|jgi:ethanolamine utilization protein EutN|nr:ethanolamine utilization protein EutN [Gemmatimonadaceae bacterium]MDP6017217.1 EutN/CcmL family microcompartment protein [Candidatus Latescibacterota bacterium]HJP34054.1 EutN/CcmL family microcompartment protein [Candidatus Latescibacterota bacterium]